MGSSTKFCSLLVLAAVLSFLAIPLAGHAAVRSTNPLTTNRLLSTANINLSAVTAITEMNGQLYGLGAGQLALIGENGVVSSSTPVGIKLMAGLSPFRQGLLLAGDASNNTLSTIDPKSGQTTKLFALSEIARGNRPEASVLQNCGLASVAFDGESIFIAVKAGYSSSIFKINPNTRQILLHAWAPGPNPTAMNFVNGGLYVLDNENQQLRRYDASLQLNLNAVSVAPGARGIIIRNGNVVVASASNGLSIAPMNLAVLQAPSSASVIAQPTKGGIMADHGTWGSTTVAPKPQKIAVLICGGLAESGFDEFWNDTVWMYKTLIAAGFTKQYIYVLYGNGNDYISANPNYKSSDKVTDFAATMANVSMVLDGLKNGNSTYGILKMMPIDYLYVWTFDHGSGNNPAYLCLTDGNYSDTNFATKLNAIPYNIRAVFMQQCRSGGFTDNLAGGMSFVSTACMASENAHRADTENEVVGGATYHHGEYNYWVISAFAGKTPTGVSVNADSDASGKVSALEAHNWMVSHENQPETPQKSDIAETGRGFYLK